MTGRSPGSTALRLGVVLLLLAFIAISGPGFAGAVEPSSRSVRIGVLAKLGVKQCLAQWSPTATYLEGSIPGHRFVIIPLEFSQLHDSVKGGEVDFILANSSFYVELEMWYGTSRIVTMRNLHSGGSHTSFGGLIFRRADRVDIPNLRDLAGKRFMAVEETSFGGWRMAWRELLAQGIDPYDDFGSLSFGGTHDAVVQAVLKGEVDAGAVRTDTLERMALTGAIRLDDFTILNNYQDKDPNFPFASSTPLYPEWPLASVSHTSPELSQRVAVALLNMPSDHPAAGSAQIAGWTIPLNYQPVHDCLRELRVGPYEELTITVHDVVVSYWPWLLTAALLLLTGAAAANLVIVRVNRKLARKTAELSLLADNIETQVWYLATPDVYGAVNQAHAKFLGIERTRIEGRRLTEVLPDRPLAPCIQANRDVFEHKLPVRYEEWQPNAVGERRLLEIAKFPKLDAAGKVEYVVCSGTDITARKKMEEALRESESFLTHVFESIQDGLYVVNSDFSIRSANRVIKEWFGDNTPLTGLICHQRLHRRETPCEGCPTQRCLVSGHAERTIMAGPPNSPMEWIELFSYPMKDAASGEITGVVAFIRDISERKKATDALEQEMAINRTMTSISRKLITLTDDLPAVTRLVLDQALEISGSSEGIVLCIDPNSDSDICLARTTQGKKNGRPGMVLERRDDRDDLLKRLHTSLPHEAHFDNNAATRPTPCGSGNRHPRIDRYLSVPIRYGKRHLGGIVVANRERDYDERELAVMERLADLCGLTMNSHQIRREQERLIAELRQSQKMEALGTLAGGIAHDFNNMLTPIMGYAEMILYSRPEDKSLTEDMQNIIKAAYRARNLVQQILTFSRKKEHELIVMDVQPILKEALKLLAASLPSTLTLKSNIRGDCGAVLADPSQIHQVLMNLCTNAFHAIGDHDGLIEVSLDQVEVPADTGDLDHQVPVGTYNRLTVRDNGCGINATVKERIFEPYFTTKEKNKGTGLGLAVVHGIIKSYGGTIVVESQPGMGSTFQVFLPVIRRAASAMEQQDSITDLPTGDERILLVDDEPQVTTVMTALLEQLGYTVTIRNESPAALDLFTQDPGAFDLVISDQVMPRMSGMELAVKLMALRPDLPILLISGFSDLLSKEDALSVGVRGFLMKPLGVQEIARSIRAVFDHGNWLVNA